MNAGLIFFRIARYLKYIIMSQNRKGHGIHSPFVFDLVTRVFGNKTDASVVYNIEKARKKLIKDKGSIWVTDLGSGSDDGRPKQKKVADIARHSAVPEKYGVLLSNMAARFGSPLIIEFGTSFGISTMYLASAAGDTPVLTMEGCRETADIATGNFRNGGFGNIRLNVGSFEDNLPKILDMGVEPGLIFIDGNHRKDAVLDYFEKLAEISGNDTVIILDDINYSPEMEEAWHMIRSHEKVTITVDIFRMGIVFFREGAGKARYMIRY
jgi:predicted O-methyltransferase YrrM